MGVQRQRDREPPNDGASGIIKRVLDLESDGHA